MTDTSQHETKLTEERKSILNSKAYQKGYYEQNKDVFLAKRKEHYEQNKAALLAKSREYYEQNKEKIAEKKNEKITCECGCIINKSSKVRHLKSKKHDIQIHKTITNNT